MTLKPTIVAGIVIVCCGLAVHARQTRTAETPRPEVTKAQVERWMTELSNWGRWGKDDQLAEPDHPAEAPAGPGAGETRRRRLTGTAGSARAHAGGHQTRRAFPRELVL
jgi:hypothetical protein